MISQDANFESKLKSSRGHIALYKMIGEDVPSASTVASENAKVKRSSSSSSQQRSSSRRSVASR